MVGEERCRADEIAFNAFGPEVRPGHAAWSVHSGRCRAAESAEAWLRLVYASWALSGLSTRSKRASRAVDSAASVRRVRFSPPLRIWLTRPGETPIRAGRSARVRPRSRRDQVISFVSWVTRASISSSIWDSAARWSGETPGLKPIGASTWWRPDLSRPDGAVPVSLA